MHPPSPRPRAYSQAGSACSSRRLQALVRATALSIPPTSRTRARAGAMTRWSP